MADYSNLKTQIDLPVECFVFDSIASTNDHFSTLEFSKKTQICITREQTQGKGQYDRVWLSQKDSNILFSIRRVFNVNVDLNGLSLVVGLAVVSALKTFDIQGLKLKWPNDVFFNAKKLAGILIENTVQGQNQSVIIGLGLNYNLGKNFKCHSPWVDLANITQDLPTMNVVAAKLINQILEYCQLFELHGLSYFMKSWQQVDYLINTKAEIEVDNQKKIGIIRGINQHGALALEVDGQLVAAYSSKQIRLI